jgi:peptidoglycan/LPS O-acetylase OafA/YrhL
MIQRLPALDGLRAIAVLSVIGSHVFTSLIPGSFGVTLFFFISGFIITRLLLADPGPLSSFYVRRFFRLYPALLAYIAASVVSMHLSGERVRWDGVAAGLLFYTNYHSETSGYFTHLWSLAVEEHFYILFPLLVVYLRSDRLLVTLISCLIVALAVRSYEFYAGYDHAFIQGATHTRIDSIAYGCLVSVLFHRAQTSASLSRFLDTLSTWPTAVFGLALLALSFAARSEEFRQTVRYSIQGIAFALLFCTVFWRNSAPGIFVRILESKWLGFIGAISYSLYLFHELARMIAFRMGHAQFTLENIALTMIITIPAALISYYFIEEPCRHYGALLAAQYNKRSYLKN